VRSGQASPLDVRCARGGIFRRAGFRNQILAMQYFDFFDVTILAACEVDLIGHGCIRT
jgi:hypothetical protein